MTRAPLEPRGTPAARPGFALGPLVLAALAACSSQGRRGPELRLENPEGHRVFVDGRETRATTLPFRYYGTTAWHALPEVPVENGVPRFDREPAGAAVAIPAPANPLLFPFDFPLELLDRLLHGPDDRTATITARDKPRDERIDREIPQDELGRLSARGRAARVAR